MAETSDKHKSVVGEKSTYAIDASGQKGEVTPLLSRLPRKFAEELVPTASLLQGT